MAGIHSLTSQRHGTCHDFEKKSYCAKHNYSYFFFNGKLSNRISVYVPEYKFLFISE